MNHNAKHEQHELDRQRHKEAQAESAREDAKKPKPVYTAWVLGAVLTAVAVLILVAILWR